MDGCRLFLYVVLWSVVVGIKNLQCPDGFYGSSCQHECPVTCNNKQCKIDEFGRASCIDGCVDGYRGTSCKIPCPVNCQVCERVNGSCINCKATFHGTNCTLTCEELCQGFRCDTDKTCSKTTCLDGRHGQNCSNKCYPRYLTCSQSTGACTACRDGYYGQFCELDCPLCGFADGSMDMTCKDGCKKIICSDMTPGGTRNTIRLDVFIPVVLLFAIVIAVILLLLWRLYNKIAKETGPCEKAGDEAIRLQLPNEDTERTGAAHRGSIGHLEREGGLLTRTRVRHSPPSLEAQMDYEPLLWWQHEKAIPWNALIFFNFCFSMFSLIGVALNIFAVFYTVW